MKTGTALMTGGPDGELRDRDLVANFLLNREERAFRELYRRHAPSLNRMIVRLVGTMNGDAEDVIQTTWVRAIERLDGFRWNSTLRTWLTGIAINCSREHIRRQRRPREPDRLDDLISAAPARITREISRIDLERVIASLPAGYREIIVLHDIEGYTHEEIAGLLGIDSGTSKSQLSRARKAVRAMLEISYRETT
jgi:RNA polymerase sigma factor (sigma-70 family)